MERTRRLKPHIYGARHKSREPTFANGYTISALPSNRVEAAIFDQVAHAEAEAVESSTAPRGLVMARNLPAGVTPAELVTFFNEPAAAAGAGSARARSGCVLGGERGVHLVVGDGGDGGASSVGPTAAWEAFVAFGSSDAADEAMIFLDGRRLQGHTVEVFRAVTDVTDVTTSTSFAPL